MAAVKRVKTGKAGVFYIMGTTPRGKAEKIFYIRYRNQEGKLVEEKAGRQYKDDMTPARAALIREKRIQGDELSNQDLREAQAAEKRAAVTLAEAWPVYLRAGAHRWSARYLLDHKRVIDPGGRIALRGGKGKITRPGALAALADLKLSEIDADAVKGWLAREAVDRPTQARLAFGILKAFLNWASDHPDYRALVQPDACISSIKKKVLPPKRAREDCLQREQLRAWFKSVRMLPSRTISAYLQALLLTGARRNELAAVMWDNVDFQWQSLTIHDKVEGERTIPLTPYVSALFSGLPRKNQFVFASQTARSGHIEEPRRAHNRACAAAGIEGLTLHGLRRSFGTLSEWVEVPVGIVAQIMGHKPSAIVEKHYRRRPLDLLRRWHEKIEGWILNEAGVDLTAKKEKPAIILRLVKG